MPSFSKWVELAGSDRRLAPGAEIAEAIPSNKSFEVSLVLRRRKPLPSLPSRHQPITRAEYAGKHGADPADIRKVRAFAQHFRLRVKEVLPAERTVILVASAAAFATAFRVELRTHHFPNGSSYRVHEGCISIPAELSRIVVGVFGLDNRPAVSRRARFKPAPEAGVAAENPGLLTAFFPNQLAKIYRFPEGVDGKGQTIGIVEVGGGFRRSDLAAYFKRAGVKNLPKIVVAKGRGLGKNVPQPYSQSPEPPDLEVLLDMEIIGTVAPGAKMVMYFPKDSSEQHLLGAVRAAVRDSSADQSILSLSWGDAEFEPGGEAGLNRQFQDHLNEVLETAAYRGITVCVASGDYSSAGMPSNDPQHPWDRKAHVSFPASSPFVLACGGTHVIEPTDANLISGANLREEAWHPEPKPWYPDPNTGTGGGISRYFPLPLYQRGTVKHSAVNPNAGTGRGVPDVAADAAAESGYQVLVDDQWYPDQNGSRPPLWGTSAAAPLWAGLIALLNQSLRTRLGFVNPLLYKLTASSGAFHDVTLGNNGDYRCARGWNACTGLGTPNGQNLLNALSKALKVRAATSTGKASKKPPSRKQSQAKVP
jgi:kumamolisin